MMGRFLTRRGIGQAALGAFVLGATRAQADTPKRLTIGMPADAVTLYPHIENVVGTDIYRHLFDTLTLIGTHGGLDPRLATEWTSTDAKTWLFTLRTDAKFSNGDPVRPEDVAATFNYVANTRTLAVHGYLLNAKSEVAGPNSVRVSLPEPDATFPRWTTLISILPAGIEQRMAPDAFTHAPIGSGPYTLRSFRGDRVVLAAKPDYRTGKPKIDELVFVSVPDEAARVSGLRSGELDVISNVPPEQLATLRGDSGVKIASQPNNRTQYIAFNLNTPPFNDVRVRRAVAMAIDTTAITEQVLEGLGSPVGQPPAVVTFGHSDKPEFAPIAYDPDAAKALLKQAGYTGQPVSLDYPSSGLPMAPTVAEVVGGYLSAIGMPVTLQALEWATMTQRWRAKDFRQLYMFGFGPSLLDAGQILNSLYVKGSRGFFNTPRIDEIDTLTRAEVDQAKRLSLFEEVWRLDRENQVNAWLFNEYDAYALRKTVTWTPRPDRRMYFWEADKA